MSRQAREMSGMQEKLSRTDDRVGTLSEMMHGGALTPPVSWQKSKQPEIVT